MVVTPPEYCVTHENQNGSILNPGPADLPSTPVVNLNFDDNRLNIFENAAPVMSEYGFTGTVRTISRLANGDLPDDQTFPSMNRDHLGQ
ncbi:MAG: hypothetical protein MK102_10185 [Fuerstiella sp.]|nr:hypothetical protein [Fuerstiella sp.]